MQYYEKFSECESFLHSGAGTLQWRRDKTMELQKLFDTQELPESMVKAAGKLFQSGFTAGARLGQILSDLIDMVIDKNNLKNEDYERK